MSWFSVFFARMNKLTYLFLGCAALASAGCSKKDDATPTTTQPKDYQVEYRVSSTTTTLSNVTLPATYSFTRNMKLGDSSLLLASIPGGTASSNITVTILLDGKQVKSETGTGVRAQAVPVWVIGE
jgi:hypothetical protein